MIRIKDIQEKFLHLVGWEQNHYSNLKISDDLTSSESGLYFQHVHPLLTLQNISCIAPDFKNFTGLDSSKETDLFSEWLKSKTEACITKVISRYVNDKLVNKTSKQLLEHKTLFDGTGRISDVIKNQKNIVGFEIIPIRSNGVTTQINKIGLQFTEPGEYTVYILHSSNPEPIYTLNFTKTKKNAIEWFDTNDVHLPYSSKNNDAGGSWFICYSQSYLPEKSLAIRKDRDWSKGPCNACSRHEFELWKLWSKYIEVHPFFVNEEHVNISDSIELWDVSKNQYTYDTNYGINLELTVSCDITEFIISQRNLFANLVAKQMAVDMLREFAYNANVRTNRHSINASKLDIITELDGNPSSMTNSGLIYQLDLAYKALEISTAGIDRICLPCVNNGIKYRTV